MRVINVIVIKNNAVYSIDSFRVFESGLMASLVPDINKSAVEKAEALFKTKVLEITEMTLEEFEDDHTSMDSFIEDGIYFYGDSSVCLTWSELE